MVDVEPQQAPSITTRKHLLAEGVFHLIGGRIVEGELPPGMRIRDSELAAELAVSRTPVREALQRLERIGLVTMYPSRYTEITATTPDSVKVAHAFAGLQAGIIVRLACPRLNAEELQVATELIAEIAVNVDDSGDCSRARGRAIGYLAALTGNPLQQSLVDEASLALARALRTFEITPEHRPRVITGCAALTAALRSGDADAAEQACRVIYGVD
ncbi:GntR family transcriptional regulator [Microbacterium sp. H1-D42]|uniref:GntR family transcriptional regulator n=1 Tax=Microbacterium sp. H1-D42 TaxID=2925844 RepID=UPI001F533400|nr:GntR family transcriptional regulator [Microbacterium sp. H1-D42]UNK71602.1 GntR family transcriptional regulator [Microbacterium sp. H1-D42]